MISVRIPESLLDEFKDKISQDHFMDLSEAVRSIIRNRWLEEKNPASSQIKRLKEEIKEDFSNHKAIFDEIKRLRDRL
jgi:Arc/MetJ-type ribon-helix-helix transcriptional regulator